jgi:hypothetical protein
MQDMDQRRHPDRRQAARPTPRSTFAQVVALVLAVACSPAAQAPTAVPSATAAPSLEPASVSPAPTPTDAADPSATAADPIGTGPLAAGTYETTRFEPQLTLTLGDGWTALFQDDSDEVTLERSGQIAFKITRVTRVVDPGTGQAVDVPDDLVAWVQQHDSLTVGRPRELEIAGRSASSVDASAVDTVQLFAYDEGNMRLPGGVSGRFHVVPLDGPDLTVLVLAPASSFDEAIRLAQPILDSIRIGPPG